MKLGDRLRDSWLNGLSFRLLAFLLIALLPIGLIAVIQTRQVGFEAERNANLALLALTEQASRDEQFLIERAFSAAKAMGSTSTQFRDDPDLCERYLGEFIRNTQEFSFVGFLPPSGQMTCSSSGQPYDFSAFPRFQPLMENPRRTVEVNATAPLSGTSVLIVSQPIFENDIFVGYISISLPQAGLLARLGNLPAEGLVTLLTLNADGQVLTSSGDVGAASAELPELSNIADLLNRAEPTFVAPNARGEQRIYAVKPVVNDVVHVLGVWDAEHALAGYSTLNLPPSVFPLLMWLASLIVCIFAFHRLVIRHVRRLGGEMRQFARDRAVPSEDVKNGMPAELMDMTQDFRDMATSIMQDEAALEDSVREKKLLIKEVHHRVKNNLQLISSIVNMQIRKTPDPNTKFALKRVQERVLSLATIHRDLYQSESSGHVNAGKLLREIVDHSMQFGSEDEREIDRDMQIEDVLLVPDQAVPVSLLAAEATTNALKYFGAPGDTEPWLRVRMQRVDEEYCELEFENSTSGERNFESTGLGSQLIKAFAIQLGAEVATEEKEGSYALRARFRILDISEALTDF